MEGGQSYPGWPKLPQSTVQAEIIYQNFAANRLAEQANWPTFSQLLYSGLRHVPKVTELLRTVGTGFFYRPNPNAFIVAQPTASKRDTVYIIMAILSV